MIVRWSFSKVKICMFSSSGLVGLNEMFEILEKKKVSNYF